MGKGNVEVTVRVYGVGDSIRALGDVNYRTDAAAGRGIKKSLEYLLKEIKKITPRGPTGNLRKSGQVVFAKQGRRSFGKIIFTMPYAVWVHECITKHHEPPTGPKFIEQIVNDPIHRSVARSIVIKEIAETQAKINMKRSLKGLRTRTERRGGAYVKVRMS